MLFIYVNKYTLAEQKDSSVYDCRNVLDIIVITLKCNFEVMLYFTATGSAIGIKL